MAGKRRTTSQRRSRGGHAGGVGSGVIGVLLGLFLLAGLSNGSITVPGADPNSPFHMPHFDWMKPQSPSPAPAPTGDSPAPGPQVYAATLAQLETLPVKDHASKDGYSRDQFGPAWKDVDGNAIDTRNDILIRDLLNVTFKDSPTNHVVSSGTLNDPYTGHVIHFVRGHDTSSAVQIDHRVPLANAWQTGAQEWSESTREKFANDPANLVAVDGPTNNQKSDKDAAAWLPPNLEYRCEYVRAQVEVKSTYGLWVTRSEHDAIREVLLKCD